jgi:hypothetical protein
MTITRTAWIAGGAAAGALIYAVGAKAKEIKKQGQWLNRAERTVKMHLDLMIRKMSALQKTFNIPTPIRMTDEQTVVFYKNRRDEFAKAKIEFTNLRRMAKAIAVICEKASGVAHERGLHWRLTLLLIDNCPIL